MLRINLALIILSLSLFSCSRSRTAQDGSGAPADAQGNNGWESSGGEIFRYAKNPWFVRNTETVNYCIQIDETAISASKEQVRELIGKAVTYWKSEFAEMNKHVEPGTSFAALATQNFVEQAKCAEDSDLIFKFGESQLAEDERQHLGDVRSYIGVSVRKEYDLVNLRGKGFVFVASDRGPNAYRNPGHLINEAWQHPRLLEYILIHEMGHVFGLPHSGSGIMAEVFPDQVLHKSLHTSYLDTEPPSTFGIPRTIRNCMLFNRFEPTFFQVPGTTTCLELTPSPEDPSQFVVKALGGNDSEIIAGYLRIQGSAGEYAGLRPAVIIHLPPEQEVYSARERGFLNFVIGGLYMDLNVTGFFRTKDSRKPYPVLAQVRPDRLTLVNLGDEKGAGAGQIVFEYSPPTLLKILFPRGNSK